ncbi:MAG: hypothetical protein HZC23_08605 [Rhodocyclales bacterium]|nr:hypothetical protein [Rhodocyclales bacterium]
MKKGFIGPYQLGVLSGASDALRIAEEVTQEHGADLEGIFYATAFQAGVDEFIVPDLKDKPSPKSEFLAARTRYIPRKDTETHTKLTRAAFSAYLPNGWERSEEFSSLWPLESFLIELMDAMSVGACVLSPWGIPDIAEADALLPSELSVPLSNLLASVKDVQAPSPIPQKAIPTEDIQRFNDIMAGDVFSNYVSAQYSLEDSGTPLETSLPTVVSSARLVFAKNPQLLQLRKSGLGILQITPKLVDAAFGKLPGALADLAAKLGSNFLEERRRVVIYDFRSSVQDVLLSNLVRMFKAANAK